MLGGWLIAVQLGSLAASASAKAFCVARKLEMEIIIVIRNVAAIAVVVVLLLLLLLLLLLSVVVAVVVVCCCCCHVITQHPNNPKSVDCRY